MAKVKPMILLDGLSGKVCGHSNTYFAERNGTQYTGTICNPYKGEPTEKQIAVREAFTATAEAINALTQEQKAEYESAFKKQKKYRTLRGYIFAQLYNQTNN
ncbi:MAG: hypothetical protein IKY49_02215 [Paludibacteraceae bacterium]|nr:hypothetical protein [Paludibacteraceae bacterium]